ncbi:phospholipase [Psychromonas sp. RZ22]|uniref:phospholipase A n=1 Tax=Psychromonas algarum TaxID=2555643 RepID=UPI0010686BF5|nr:phospholipase A [Psychromonas sp. RZ22]TEW54205.1 phospholipase [Psychromonas sp. RZ22]
MHFVFWVLLFFSSTILAQESAIDKRLEEEAISERSNFSIIPHKQNYILPFTFNNNIQNYNMYRDQDGETTQQRIEIKYQISFKMPLFHHIGNLPISGYFAYSQTSYWQAYNTENSSPFRETDYEPEGFLVWEVDHKLGAGWNFKVATIGFTHQSNGQSDPISRSWNRINANLLFEHGNFVVNINPWYRFKDSPDNNPDLIDYYGHGEILFAYKHNEHVYSLTSRNNLESGFNRGSVEATWSFPLYGKVKGYMQAFSGYGNSLVEYDLYTNTLGIGISISDFL